jgi:PAS domain S-box-containing protein
MDLLKACYNYKKLWDEILSAMQQAIVVTDLEGRILFSVPVVKEMVGFDADELNNRNISILFTSEDLGCLYPNILFLARRNRLFDGEVMLVRKDGSRFIAYLSARTCYVPALGETLIIFSFQDIDRQKKIEKSFKEIHYEDLVKVADGIAHELRNPLQGIGGFATRLHRVCRGEPEENRYYEQIMGNLRKIETLVNEIGYLVRLPEPRFTNENIRELVQEAVKPFYQELKNRCIDLNVRMNGVVLRVDRELVMRTISILVRNAMDAITDRGSITITDETGDNHATVYVSDSGAGISTRDLPYIFNPFFTTKPDGTGIDLALVNRIMESHEGYVGVKSKVGEGTTFFLNFPIERRRPIRRKRLKE